VTSHLAGEAGEPLLGGRAGEAPAVDGQDPVPGPELLGGRRSRLDLADPAVEVAQPEGEPEQQHEAISRFIAGPAAITTIRFQTGWW
jgi:hypothetical protein